MKNKTVNMIICGVVSLVIPIFIMVFAYYRVGIYPGGPNTVLTFDMQTQYMPFFASLRYLRSSDNSLFFNMSGALGNNFMGFAYYIFSPFTWITVLFPLELLPEAIYFSTLLRIGICGLNFCIYLLHTFKDKRYYLGTTLLSCCYALMSYNVGYSINIMWLDAILMLPIILVGVERSIRDRKTTVLTFSIAFSMVCNYYITCMSLVFVALYTGIRLTELKKWDLKRVLHLALGGFIGIGLSMPVVLPGVMALKYGKMDEASQPFTNLFRYNIVRVMGQLLSGRYDTVFDDGLPLLFCGTGTIFLIICFFISRHIEFKVKLLYGGVIAFYLFSMCFVPMDRAMQGFRETVCFEVRYSYAFCCLLLIVAYRAIEVPLEIMEKYKMSRMLKYLWGVFVIIELIMNSSILISGLMIELHYRTAVEYDMILRDKTALLEMIEDEGFYRVSDDNAYTDNDGAWLGYNGFGYFSSCYNLKLMDYLGSLGECQSYHILEDQDRSPLEESLFGAKYKLSYADWRKADEIIAAEGFYTLSKNNDALSLGYMVDFSSDKELIPVKANAFENQNNLAKDLSGIDENLFVNLEPIDYDTIVADGNIKIVKLDVITENDAPVWIYIGKKEKNEIKINKNYDDYHIEPILLINGGDYGTYRGNDTGAFYELYLGDFEAGEKINIELVDYDDFGEIYVSQFDENVYHKIIDKLKGNQLKLSEHSAGRFEGRIDAGAGGNMILTLPAIDGWKIRVNGKLTDYDNYRGVFVLIPLSSGMNDLEIWFISPGCVCGVILGTVSALVFILLLIGKKGNSYEKRKRF